MFIQIVEGRVHDGDAMRGRVVAWHQELRGVGYLGSTHGYTPDGSWISIVRFESAAAARRTSEQPEQGGLLSATSGAFDGEVRLDDCPEVDVVQPGSDQSGFVQVLRGRAADKEGLRALLREIAPVARDGRPHLIGAVYAWAGDEFTNTVYFTSEAEAREGEAAKPPPHMERWRDTVVMESLRFLDLRDPILLSP